MADSRSLRSRRHRGAGLGLRDDELAFYDAVCQNDSAVMELGDDVLKTIAQELVALSVRTPPSTGTSRSRFERQCAATSVACSSSTVPAGQAGVGHRLGHGASRATRCRARCLARRYSRG